MLKLMKSWSFTKGLDEIVLAPEVPKATRFNNVIVKIVMAIGESANIFSVIPALVKKLKARRIRESNR
jgi:hypothetical protein